MKFTSLIAPFVFSVVMTLQTVGMTISGSDLFGDSVREALAAELKANGLEAEIQFNGSLLGLRDLEAGTVDASLLAIPDGRGSESGMRQFPVAFQVVTCLVHFTNPVEELSYDQLVNLFRDNGTIEDWSDLTTLPAWADRKVTLVASRRDRAVTLELFNSMVLEGAILKPSVRFLADDNAGLLEAVADDPGTIMLAPAITPDSSSKLLAVKETETDQGYTPSLDNVFFGDYPLRLPFYLVVPDAMDDANLGKLLRAVYSDSVTEALTAANGMPIPLTEKSAILSQFE